ncbi:hypothetical protein ABBQ32_006371 [Trebouxia sp. C0010 RCD-2024]
MVDADYHLNGNNVSRRSDSAVEMADLNKPHSLSSDSPHIEEPFVGAHNAKKYKVEWSEPDHGVLNDPLITDVSSWLKHQKQKTKYDWKTSDWWDVATVVLPMLRWVRRYNIRQNLLVDIVAGISVGAMVVPQGMSYARLAGLPDVFGLYGAFVPVLIYAGLGSSPQLAVGPVAVTSLLLGTGLKDLISSEVQSDPNNPANPQAQMEYNMAAIQVALLAGCMYTAVGLLRLGWITNFLSHSVICGFMTGASVIIGLSQVKFLFGYSQYTIPSKTGNPKDAKKVTFPRHDPIQEQLHDLLGPEWTPYFHWREFVMGGAFIVILLSMKYIGKRFPRRLGYLRSLGPVTVTVLGIAIVNIFDLQCPSSDKNKVCAKTIRVVGNIPKGLPGCTIGWWSPIPQVGKKLGYAIIICLIDVLESISIAKALALKNRYQINPTQELRGLGVANLFGAAFNCYTTTGSFSRSAVMDSSGAKSQLAGIVSAIVVMFVLLFLTPVFKNMPQNVLGAIVISAIVSLFNYSEWFFLWKINKFDWLVFNAAWLGVMFAGVEIGLAISIGLSVVIVLYKTGFPHHAVLGRLPGTTVYRNVKQYPEAREQEGMLLVRIDSPIYFANVAPIREAFDKYQKRAEAQMAAKGGKLLFIIVDLSPVTDIDASAVHFLMEWVRNLKANSIQPVFSNPARQVVRLFEAARLPQVIGEEFMSVRMHDAVTYCQELMVEGQDSYKLSRITEGVETAEDHRKEAHKLAGQTYIGPPV